MKLPFAKWVATPEGTWTMLRLLTAIVMLIVALQLRLTDYVSMHNETLGMKTEYYTEHGSIEAFIVNSGCMFWGGTNLPHEQKNILVYPVDVIDLQEEINKQVRKDYKQWKKENLNG